MILKKLKLLQFRNYEKEEFYFDEGIHFFTGKNAQGKTNLLEAISYLSTTRSHRTMNDDDLIQEDKSYFGLEADIEKTNRNSNIRIYVNENGKNLFVYRNPIKKVSDFIGEFNAVMFCPDDMMLFHASPKVRRKFIDMEISKISKVYTKTLNTYHKILKERNSYLKLNKIDQNYLEVLNERLIECEIVIVKQRDKFLKELLEKSMKFYRELSQDETELTVEYMTFVSADAETDKLREEMILKYKKSLDRDLMLSSTTQGVHKDDFTFYINGKDVDVYASQGQKRTILLALKLGIVSIVYSITKEYPVLLLDDVFSELDTYRRNQLLEILPKEVQIFISATDPILLDTENDRKITYWKIQNGKLTSLKEES